MSSSQEEELRKQIEKLRDYYAAEIEILSLNHGKLMKEFAEIKKLDENILIAEKTLDDHAAKELLPANEPCSASTIDTLSQISDNVKQLVDDKNKDKDVNRAADQMQEKIKVASQAVVEYKEDLMRMAERERIKREIKEFKEKTARIKRNLDTYNKVVDDNHRSPSWKKKSVKTLAMHIVKKTVAKTGEAKKIYLESSPKTQQQLDHWVDQVLEMHTIVDEIFETMKISREDCLKILLQNPDG